MSLSKNVTTAALALVIAALGCATGGTVALAAGSTKSGADQTEYVWSMDLDCSLCHQKEWESIYGAPSTESAMDTDSNDVPSSTAENDKGGASSSTERETSIEAYGALHAHDFELACTTCHADEQGMEAAHAKLNNGREAKRLKKTSVDSELCLTCHDQKALAEATADVDVLTDSEGTVVNPHDLPDVADHATISCTDCHKVHTAETKTLEQTAMTACTNCHHADVFECGTCH